MADEAVASHPRAEAHPRQMSTLTWVFLSSSLIFAEMSAALDNTITADLQPAILATLGEITKFPWINVTYQLGNSSTCLLWKWTFLVARVLYAVGSAISASAPTMNAFIVGKVIAGIGGSGTYIGCIAIFTALTDAQERPRYYSYTGFSWGLGTIIGPVIGGAFGSSQLGWRWAFYMNVFMVGITLPIVFICLPSPKRGGRHSLGVLTQLQKMDSLGMVLFSGAVVTAVMAFSLAGSLCDWKSGPVIATFSIAGLLWPLFYLQQYFEVFTSHNNRTLPIHILKSLEMWTLFFQVACPVSILYVLVYYIPLYFQFVQGETAFRAALHILPFLTTAVVFMILSGRLIFKISYYKVWFLTGGAFSLAGSVCLYYTGLSTSYASIYGYEILCGVGIGSWMMNAGPVMTVKVPSRYTSDAGILFGFADTVSGAFAIAIANCIFVNRATSGLETILPNTSRSAIQQSLAGVGSSLFQNLSEEAKSGVLEAILEAIQDVWILIISTSAFAILLNMFLRTEKVRDMA